MNPPSDRSWALEALESRVLLSGDGAAAALDAAGMVQEGEETTVVIEEDAGGLVELQSDEHVTYEADSDEVLFGEGDGEVIEVGPVVPEESPARPPVAPAREVAAAPPASNTEDSTDGTPADEEAPEGLPEETDPFAGLLVTTLDAAHGPPAGEADVMTPEDLQDVEGQVLLGENKVLAGSGEIMVPVFNRDGVVSPGEGLGDLVVSSYAQWSEGSLWIEVGENAAGAPQADRLHVNGDATLGGQLAIGLAPGYEPQVGDKFTILTWGGQRTGEFDGIFGTAGFGDGLYFETNYTDHGLELEVTHNTTVSPTDQTAILDLLEQFAQVGDLLDQYGDLGGALPVIQDAVVGAGSAVQTVGDIIDTGKMIRDVIRDTIDTVFTGVSVARSAVTTALQNLNTQTLQDYLMSVTGVNLVEPSAGNYYWEVDLAGQRTFSATLDPGSQAALGATFSGGATITGTATYALDFNFGIDTSVGGVFVEIDGFSGTLDVDVTGLNFSVDLTQPAAASLGVTGGTVDFDASVSVAPKVGITTGNRITLATLQGMTAGTPSIDLVNAFDLTATGSVAATLPLTGSVSGSNFSLTGSLTAKLTSADIFTTPPSVTIDSTGFGLAAQAGFTGENFSGTFSARYDGGETTIVANITNFEIAAGATRILQGSGSGVFLMDAAYDVAGRVSLTISQGPDIPDTSLSGTFDLKFNTGSSAVTTIAGVTVDLEAGPYVRIEGNGTLALTGSPGAVLGGNFLFEKKEAADTSTVVYFAITSPTITFSDGSNTLLSVTGGSAAFVFDSTNPGFAGTASGLTITVNVPGIGSVTGTLSLAVNTTSAAVNKTVTVGGSGVTINLPAGPYFRVDGSGVALALTVEGAAYNLAGDFSFEQRTVGGSKVVAVGVTNLSTSITDGAATSPTTLLSVTGGSGGFIFSDDGVAGEVTGTVDILPSNSDVTITAGTLVVEVNTTEASVNETITTPGGSVAVALAAGPYLRLAGSGITLGLTIGSASQSVTGNFSFERSGPSDNAVLKVGASNVTATLAGPGTVTLTATDGTGAFLVTNAGIAGEVTVSVALNNVPGITLTGSNIKVSFNTTGADVASTSIITSADPSNTYTLEFTGSYYHDFFAVQGAATIGTSFADLQGNFAFQKASVDLDGAGPNPAEEVIKVGVTGLNFTLKAGSTDVVSFNNGNGAFIINTAGVAGQASLDFQVGLVSVSGSIKLDLNTTNAALSGASVPTAGGTTNITLAAGNYLKVCVDGNIQVGTTSFGADFIVEVDLGTSEVVLKNKTDSAVLVTIDSAGNVTPNFPTINFANPTPESIIAMLKSLIDWFQVFSDSDFFKTEIPFTSTTIGDAINWTDNLLDQLYSWLITAGFKSGVSLDFGAGNITLPSGTFELDFGGTTVTVDTSAFTGSYNQADFETNLQAAVDAALSAAGLGTWVDIGFDANSFLTFDLTQSRIAESTTFVLSQAGIFDSGTFSLNDATAAVERALDDTIAALVDRIGDRINAMRTAAGLGTVPKPSYDPDVQMILWPFALSFNESINVPLNFSEDIGPVAGVSISGDVTVSIEAGVQFTLGFDWGASRVPRLLTNSFTPTPSSGVITEDANFVLIINEDTGNSFDFSTSGLGPLTAASTSGNTTVEDLAADFNALLGAQTYDADGDGTAEPLTDFLWVQKAGSGLAISVVHELDEDGDGNPDTDLNGNGQLDQYLGVVNKIEVIADKEDTFSTEVGFGAEGSQPDGTADPNGSHWKTTSVVSQRGLFIDGLTASAGLTVSSSPIAGSLRLGFVELSFSDAQFQTGTAPGGAASPITVSFNLKDGDSGATRFYLADLFTNSNSVDLGDVLDGFSISGGFYAKIDGISVGVAGTGFDLSLQSLLGSNAEISVFIPDITKLDFNPEPYHVDDNNEGIFLTYPDLESVLDFENFGFSDLIRALRVVTDMLEGLQGFDFLDKDIPLINASVNDLIDYVGKVAELIEAVSNSPQDSIQQAIEQFEQQLEDLFDLAANVLTVEMPESGILSFSLDFDTAYAEALPLQLSLNDLVGLISDDAGGFADFLDGVTQFISVGGSGNLTVSATAALALEFGIDLSDSDNIRAFLGDDTGVTLTLKVLGTDLEFEAAIGSVFGIFVRDGTVTLNQDGDPDNDNPATFTLGLRDNNGDGRHYFDEDFFNWENITLDLDAGVSAILPVFFPDDDFPLGGDDDENGDGFADNALVLDIPDLVRVFLPDTADGTTADLEFRGDNNDLEVTGPDEDFKVELRNNGNLNGAADASYDGGSKTLTVTIDSGETQASAVKSAIEALAGFSVAYGAGDGGGPAGSGTVAKITLAAPDFAGAFESLTMCDIINAYADELLDGFDFLLESIQDALSAIVLSTELPLVGDGLADAVTFIDDFRSGVVAELRTRIETSGGAINALEDAIKEAIWYTLGPGGIDILADPETGEAYDASLGYGQLDVTLDCEDGLLVNLLLSKELALLDTSENPIDFDIGVPGFGLAVEGNVLVAIGFDLKLRFGINKEDGFFIQTGGGLDWTDDNGNGIQDGDEGGDGDTGDPEMRVSFEASIPGLAATGQLAFLQLDVVDGHDGEDPSAFGGYFSVDLMDPNNDGKLTWAEITSSGLAFEDVIEGELTAEAHVNLDLAASFGGDARFPRLVAEFDLDWVWTLGEESEGPTIAFNNIGLDLGSFISDFLGPVLEEIRKVTEPLDPIIDIVTAEIPVLSDLAGEPVTLLSLAETFGLLEPSTVKFINSVIQVVEIINNIPVGEGELIIPIGSFKLNEDEDGERSEIELLSAVSEIDLGAAAAAAEPGATTSPSFQSQAAAFGESVTNLDNFSFPFLDNPMELFGLLVGKDVTLVRWDLPKFKFEFSYSQSFPIYPPLYAEIGGKVGAIIDIGFGYDTYGLRQLITGESDNPLVVFDGFFVADTDAQGKEKPELTLYGSLWAGASINLLIAEAGVRGGLEITVDFDLNDPNDDGKVRVSELVSNALLDPRCIFDISGRVGLFLEAFLKIDLFFISIDKTWRFADITLFEFEITCPDPILASVDGSGELLLHMGSNAGLRQDIDTTDGAETFRVSHVSGDPASADGETVKVQYEDWTQEYSGVKTIVADGGAQDDVIDLGGVLAPVVSITGGAGNDVITLGEGDGDGGSAIHVDGGEGADTIVAASGENLVISGGAGADTLTAGSVAIEIRGGAGADTITGSAYADILLGEEGADTITGNDGDDDIDGGGGNDTIDGNDGNDVIAGGSGNDAIRGGKGEDEIDGGSGDDEIFGGLDVDLIRGGDGSDQIYGQSGADILIGDDGTIDNSTPGTPVLTGISGSGNDFLYGGGGMDVLFGGDGDDYLFGGVLLINGETQVVQEDGNDFIDGGRGNDTALGDDAFGTTGFRNTGMSISSSVWLDTDGDGRRDFVDEDDNGNGLLDAGEDQDGDGNLDIVEEGVPGVLVELVQDIASVPVLGSFTTRSDGSFEFLGLKNTKDYFLRFTLPGGYLFTTQDAGSDDTIDSDADTVSGVTHTFQLDLDEKKTDVAAGLLTFTPSLVILDASVDEGGSNQTSLDFYVTLTRAYDQNITVDYETQSVTASPSLIYGNFRLSTDDYDPASGSLTFAPGEKVKTISVLVNGDRTYEDRSHEELKVKLSNLVNASFAYGDEALGIIIEDDDAPRASIGDFVPEELGDTPVAEDSEAVFTVTLDRPSDSDITLQWTTQTATTADGDYAPNAADAGSDYAANSNSITFLAGETEKTITIDLLPDDLDEVDENFFVRLFNPVGDVVIEDPLGVGIIPDDDAEVLVHIHHGALDNNEHTVVEGDYGYTDVTFTVSLVDPASTPFNEPGPLPSVVKSGKTVKVDFSDARGTAFPEFDDSDPLDELAYGDYEPTSTSADVDDEESTTLTFLPGEMTKEITVRVKGDIIVEGDEEFFVNLFNPDNAGIYNNHGIVKITEDDFAAGVDLGGLAVALGSTDVVVDEDAGSVSIQIIRAQSLEASAVVLSVYSGTATSGTDFIAPPRQLIVFEPNDHVQYVNITILDDSTWEGDEEFYIGLRAITGAPLGVGTVTITEDEPEPVFTIDNPAKVTEGSNTTFTVTIDLPDGVSAIQDSITLTAATENITATAGADYTPDAAVIFFFDAGLVTDGYTQTASLTTLGDLDPEVTEEFGLRIQSFTAGRVLDGFGIARIGDDDPVTITGKAFQDANGNGFKNNDEGGLEEVDVTLTDVSGVPVTVATDEFGNFSASLLLGAVTLQVDETTLEEGFLLTTGNDSQEGDWQGGFSPLDFIGYQMQGVEDVPEDPASTGSGFTHDTIFGGPGNDDLDGGGGDDLIVGGHWQSATNANAPINNGSYDASLFQTPFLGTDFWQVDVSGLAASLGSISGYVWSDTDLDGIQDGGESGVADVVVRLKDSMGNTIQAVFTDGGGTYTFDDIYTGDYLIEVENPEGTAFTLKDQGANDAVDSDVDAANRQSDVFTLGAGVNLTGWDAGLTPAGAAGTAATGLGFSEASYSIAENDPEGEAVITVTRGDATQPLAVVYRASDGTATDGVEYDAVSGLLIFGVGDTEKNFSVPVYDTGLPLGESRSVFLSLRIITGQPVAELSVLHILGASNNLIADDDDIRAGDGDDYILGDSGTISPDGLNIVDKGGLGEDTIEGGGGDDYLNGQLGDDVLNANDGGSQVVLGGFDDDEIGAEIDDQLLDGGDGTDTIISTWDGDFFLDPTKLDLLDPDDGSVFTTFTLVSIEVAKLTGGPSANTFTLDGWTGEAYLDGDDGEDSIDVTANLDMTLLDASLTTAEQADFKAAHGFEKDAALVLSNGSTYHLGSFEAATLTGGAGNNTLDASGFAGGVTMTGGAGDDTLIGGPGDDTFLFDADSALGSDTVTGGGGTDLVDLSATTAAVVVDLSSVGVATPANANLTLTFTAEDIEQVAGGAGDDTLTGNSLPNILLGGPGTDTLAGGGGNDYYAYDLDVPWGADVIVEFNGGGDDTIDFSATTSVGVTLDLSILGVAQTVSPHLDLTIGGDGEFETVIGGTQNDVLTGNGVANALFGNDGNDILNGGGGNDILDGGSGNDEINGGTGTDSISGNADTDFTLSNTGISWAGETDSLDSIEEAKLTGGSSPNVFTINGWTGNLVVNGKGGVDALMVTDDADMTAADTTLALSTGGAYVFGNVEALTLTGGASGNVLDASAITGTGDVLVVNLNGEGGNDTLIGTPLDDNLDGGAGDDDLTGGAGDDNLDGGADDDTLIEVRDTNFTASDGLILIGTEADLITGIENADLTGGAGSNAFYIAGWTTGNLSIDGLGGPIDFVQVLADADVTVTDTDITIAGAASPVSITGIERVWLVGGTSDNILDASAYSGLLQIDADAGNDTLIVGAGGGGLNGEDGHDTYVFDADTPLGSVGISDSDGEDTLDFSPTTTLGVTVDLSTVGLQAVNANLVLTLAAGDMIENLVGTPLVDSLTGNTLDNTFEGLGGGDTIDGGAAGNDSLRETADDDMVLSPGSLDIAGVVATLVSIEDVELTGGPSANNLDASLWTAGRVTLTGLGGNDILTGGSGSDILEGGAGDDTLKGVDGDDTYVFDADSPLGTDSVAESALGGSDTLDFSATTTLGVSVDLGITGPQVVNANLVLDLQTTLVENVIGTPMADTLKGNLLDNQLTGGGGVDFIDGVAGTNWLVETRDADFTAVDSGATDALVTIGSEVELVLNVSLLYFTGGDSANLIDASGFTLGGVAVLGGGGSDIIYGSAKADILQGGDGNDIIYAAGGNDFLVGNGGNDRLYGGDGDDSYVFDLAQVLGVDTIYEFDNGGLGGNDELFGPGGAVSLATTLPQMVTPDLYIILANLNVESSS